MFEALTAAIMAFAANPFVAFAGGVLFTIILGLITNAIWDLLNRQKERKLLIKIENIEQIVSNQEKRDEIYRKIGISSLSKQQLVSKMREYGLSVDTIVFETGVMKGDSEKKAFKDRIKLLGFRGIGPQLNRGVYFLPPNRMPFLTKDFDLEKWFKEKAVGDKSYERLNIPFLFIMDLAYMKTIKGSPQELDFYNQLEKYEVLSIQNMVELAEKRKIPLDEFLNETS